MTEKDHRLMIEMFKHQTRVISTLVAVLEGREIIEQGDLDAYDALVAADESQVSELENHVEETYRGFAKVLGVNVGSTPAD